MNLLEVAPDVELNVYQRAKTDFYGKSGVIVGEFLATCKLVMEVESKQPAPKLADRLKKQIERTDMRGKVNVATKGGHVYLVRVGR